MSRPSGARALARAKVNLGLQVLGRRPDGYHELRSFFLRLGLADVLTVEPGGGAATADREADRLTVTGRPAGALGDNLVLAAARVLRAWADRPLAPLAFRLEKRVPVGAGLGGGSSDAAAALDLAAAAWRLDVSPAQRLALAAAVGSDVPFFAADVPAALVEGRGERVSLRPAPPGARGVLLATPPYALPTGAVFAAHAALAARGGEPRAAGPPGAGRLGALPLGNDLWPAATALRPELAALEEALRSLLERPIVLSGSGPTLVALYPSTVEAAAAAARLERVATPALAGVEIIATSSSQSQREQRG